MNKIIARILIYTWRIIVAGGMGLSIIALTVAADTLLFNFIDHPMNMPLAWVFSVVVFCVFQDQYERLLEKYKKM